MLLFIPVEGDSVKQTDDIRGQQTLLVRNKNKKTGKNQFCLQRQCIGSFHWIPTRVKAEYSSSILATMKSPHTSLLSLETQHGLADMVAPGKTHNIIGTKTLEHAIRWLVTGVCAGPSPVLGVPFTEGRFDLQRPGFCRGVGGANWAVGGAKHTQRWCCCRFRWRG